MNDAPLLSPLQRRIAGAALVTLAAGVLCAAIVAAVFLAAAFVNAFASVLWPLVIAGICSLLVRPVVSLFERVLKCNRTWSIFLLFLCGLIVAFGIVGWVLPVLMRQCVEFAQAMPAFFSQLGERIALHFPDLSESAKRLADAPWVKDALAELPAALKPLANASGAAFAKAGQTLVTVAAMVTGAALLPIYLFYFLKSDADWAHAFGDQLTFLPTRLRDDLVFLIREFRDIILAFFRGQICIGLIMGALYGLGFSLAGLKFGFFLGLCLGLLNIVPYVGTIVGLVVILPLSFFQTGGGWALLGITVGVFTAVQLLEGYYLTPKIMGDRTGLHPLVIIVSLLFWGIALDGILGMVLAVPLTAFLMTFWRLLRTQYLPQLSRKNAAAA